MWKEKGWTNLCKCGAGLASELPVDLAENVLGVVFLVGVGVGDGDHRVLYPCCLYEKTWNETFYFVFF